MSDMRLGMLIDLAKCIGCNACVVACRLENETPLTKFNTWIESWDVEDGNGYVRRSNVPKQCNHCDNPACVEACPTGASYIAEDGTVQIDDEKCVGCDACVAACPYEARYHVDDENIVRKCTFCHHRTQFGMLPACVGACVAGARMFGDLNDPDSDISKAIAAAGETGPGDSLHRSQQRPCHEARFQRAAGRQRQDALRGVSNILCRAACAVVGVRRPALWARGA